MYNSDIYLPDKDQIVSTIYRELKRWSSTSGECLQTLQGHTSSVNSVIYLPDKDQLVSCSNDNTLKRWSVPILSVPSVNKKRSISDIVGENDEHNCKKQKDGVNTNKATNQTTGI